MTLPYDFFQQVDRKMMFIVLGDTDSMFINVPSIKPQTTEEAVAHANKISKDINTTIAHVMNTEILPKMGINPKFNRTEFKTEIVANGLLLMAVKKNYAYRMLANEGKVMDPPIVLYTGIGVKSDQTQWTKDFIRKMVEEIILNPSISQEQAGPAIQKLAAEMKEQIKTHIQNFDFPYIGVPKKWGTKYKDESKEVWQVTAMKLYNTIMNERILVPMSGSLQFPIKITNPQEFERKIAAVKNNDPSFIGNTPISKLSFLAIPYSYDKQQVQKAMAYYGIVIDPEEVWDKICNKSIKDIVSIFYSTANNSI